MTDDQCAHRRWDFQWNTYRVKSHGKITRVWNDGLYGGKEVSIAGDMVFEYWIQGSMAPQEILDLGISIVNSDIARLYYVLQMA